MSLSSDQLKEFTEWAEKGLSPFEISTIMELDWAAIKHDFISNDTELFKAFNKGFFKLKAELNSKIINQAKNGNSAAQEKLHDLLVSIQNKILEQ